MKQLIILSLFITSLLSTTVTDMLDRQVEVSKDKKIVAIGPGALRLITYMQLQDRLAGVEGVELDFDTKATYRHALNKDFIKSLPIIGQGGPGNPPNIEAIIKADPDIIFTSFIPKQMVQRLQKSTQKPVIALSYGPTYGGIDGQDRLEAIGQSLQLIGRITNKNERADKLVEFMQQNKILLQHALQTQKSVYIGGIGYRGVQGVTSTEIGYIPFSLLGLQNIAKNGKTGHLQLNLESLLHLDPDIIFFDLVAKGVINSELSAKKPIFDSLTAFKNNQTYWLQPYNFYNTNVENIFVNSYLIAYYLGLELDIETVKKQIYKTFLGIEI